MWYRYVDDTMTKIHEGAVKSFSDYLNSINPHIQFTKVLATESNTFKRRIREAIEIKLRKPSLNRDNGCELARIYDTILVPSRPLYNPS